MKVVFEVNVVEIQKKKERHRNCRIVSSFEPGISPMASTLLRSRSRAKN